MRLSAHATIQLNKRGIALSWVVATVNAPERTEPDPQPGRTRLFRAITDFGGRVLRVVVEKSGDDVEVVTVHFDRAATRRRSRG